jgi:hypothetical protein
MFSNDAIESKEVGSYTVEIYPDYDYGCFYEPAKEYWDQGIQFITWERNSTLSDLHSFTDKEAVARIGEKIGYCFNLYKYEHGLVAYNVSGFSCPWDSGQVGYLVIPYSALPEGLSATDELKSAEQLAKGVCEEITDWCNGNYVMFVVRDEHGDILDSCGGFNGSDYEYAFEEGEAAAKYWLDKKYEEDAADLENERLDMYAQA